MSTLPTPNPYVRLSDAQLADVLGALEAAYDGVKQRRDTARAVMAARGLNALQGLRFVVVRAVEGIDRLDSKTLKKTFGQEWYAKWLKPGTRTRYTVTPVPPAPVP